MKITREGRNPVGQLWTNLGIDPDAPTEDVPSPTDWALAENGGYAATLAPGGEPEFVQGVANNISDATVTLPAPPTPNNLLLLWVTARSAAGGFTPPTGFTQIGPLVTTTADTFVVRKGALSYRIVEAGDSDTVDVSTCFGATVMASLSEWVVGPPDSYASLSDQSATTTTTCGGAVTPDPSGGALVFGAAVVGGTDPTNGGDGGTGMTATGSNVELHDIRNNGDTAPRLWTGYRIIASPSGSYTVSATQDDTVAKVFGGVTATFFGAESAWAIPAPAINDGDDDTCTEISGSQVLSIQLDDTYRIVRARLRIATETSGSRTYRIFGSNTANFASEVELASTTFTAIGSDTPQDVTFNWSSATAYQYYRLEGDSETRCVYAFELFGAADDIAAVEAEIDDHITDPTDAHDASAVSIVDSGAYFTGTDVEAALQELGAGGGFDHGWYNVEDYGAVHDGVTDDTAAIQDAIDACCTGGGGTIFFPIGVYLIDGPLLDTGTYNSQLEIPQQAVTGIGIRFLGERSTLKSTWAGTISGTPSVLSAGTHDSHTLNLVFVKFERIRFQLPLNPKLTAIDMTKAITVRWDDLLIHVASTPATPPTNANAIGLDMPWGFNDQNSGGEDLYILGFYTGIRPSEQTVGTAVYIAYCARAAEFRGSSGSPDYLAHMVSFQRFNAWFCVRGLVFTGDRRSVNIAVFDSEHNDPSFETVYDIDDASNYARGFISIHISDYTTGDTADDLLMNGGSGLSIFIDHAKRWRFANVVDIPIGTNPSTNPTNGRRFYADSSSEHLSARTSAGAVIDYETEWGGVAVSGTPSSGQVPTATSGTAATWQTPSSSGGGIGPILITDTPAGSPLVFADLLQTDEGDDLLYVDI